MSDNGAAILSPIKPQVGFLDYILQIYRYNDDTKPWKLIIPNGRKGFKHSGPWDSRQEGIDYIECKNKLNSNIKILTSKEINLL